MRAQLVELGVVAARNHAAVAHHARRARRRSRPSASASSARARRCARAARCSSGESSGASCARSAGQRGERAAQAVRSRGRAERSATRARMRSISPIRRSCSRSGSKRRASIERAERLVARAQQRLAVERPIAASGAARGEPMAVAQLSRRRAGSRPRSPREARVELEVAAGGGVEDQRTRRAPRRAGAHVRQRLALCVAHVLQQRARRRGSRAAARRRRSPSRSSVPSWSVSSARGARKLEVPGRARDAAPRRAPRAPRLRPRRPGAPRA